MLEFDVRTEGLDAMASALSIAATAAQTTVAVQVAKDTEPYVPFLTGSLTQRTRVRGGKIIYPGPYARYLYYGKVMVNAATGKGAMHFTDKYGNEMYRFPKGARLVATDRDLNFTRFEHAQAQAHWFEASKAKNLEKWKRVAAKAVSEFGK